MTYIARLIKSKNNSNKDFNKLRSEYFLEQNVIFLNQMFATKSLKLA
jgi:hypothetical protein